VLSTNRNLGGGKQRMLIHTYFFGIFRHETGSALATDLHYLIYREGSVIWKQIVQRNEEQ
jgi:hypothetical protein